MAETTGIEWANATWSPVTGCSQVSPGCLNCYAEKLTATRLRHQPKYQGLTDAQGHWTGEVRCHPELLDQPRDWKTPQRIFVCSMSDLCHEKVPWNFMLDVLDHMDAAEHHTFLVLTKRPGRLVHLAKLWRERYHELWPANVWVGTSVEMEWDGKKRLTGRLDCLLEVPAKVRFVSAEPLLEPLDLTPWFHKCTCGGKPCICNGLALNWVIVGGESGPGARPFDLAWARSLRNQCQHVGASFFMKQMGRNPIDSEIPWDSVDGKGHLLLDPKGGNPEEWPQDLRVREFPA